MNERNDWQRFFKTNKHLKAIVQKVLFKDKYDLTRDGVDFMIIHFQKIGEILDKESIEYISIATAIFKTILEQTTVDNLPVLSQSFDQKFLENLKAVYIQKYYLVNTQCLELIKIDDANKDKTPGNIFLKLYFIQPNTSQIYTDALINEKYDKTGTNINKKVFTQLQNMRIATQEASCLKNHVIHLETVTLNTYEYSIKRFLQNHLPEMEDLNELINDYDNIANIIQKIPKNRMGINNAKTLLSSLNHYLRFFPNTDIKLNAKKKYRDTIITWINTNK